MFLKWIFAIAGMTAVGWLVWKLLQKQEEGEEDDKGNRGTRE